MYFNFILNYIICIYKCKFNQHLVAIVVQFSTLYSYIVISKIKIIIIISYQLSENSLEYLICLHSCVYYFVHYYVYIYKRTWYN